MWNSPVDCGCGLDPHNKNNNIKKLFLAFQDFRQNFSERVCALLSVDTILKKTIEVKVGQRKQFEM